MSPSAVLPDADRGRFPIAVRASAPRRVPWATPPTDPESDEAAAVVEAYRLLETIADRARLKLEHAPEAESAV